MTVNDDSLCSVERAREGLLKVTVMKKAADPQWKYPWWGRVDEALFDNEAEAEAYIKKCLS